MPLDFSGRDGSSIGGDKTGSGSTLISGGIDLIMARGFSAGTSDFSVGFEISAELIFLLNAVDLRMARGGSEGTLGVSS